MKIICTLRIEFHFSTCVSYLQYFVTSIIGFVMALLVEAETIMYFSVYFYSFELSESFFHPPLLNKFEFNFKHF